MIAAVVGWQMTDNCSCSCRREGEARGRLVVKQKRLELRVEQMDEDERKEDERQTQQKSWEGKMGGRTKGQNTNHVVAVPSLYFPGIEFQTEQYQLVPYFAAISAKRKARSDVATFSSRVDTSLLPLPAGLLSIRGHMAS